MKEELRREDDVIIVMVLHSLVRMNVEAMIANRQKRSPIMIGKEGKK